MKALTFCRIMGLSALFLFSAAYALEDPISRSSTHSNKCPSGGCPEDSGLDQTCPLLVFISFSMPDTSLLSLSAELEKVGGAFVIRGLPDNSFAELSNKLESLKDLGMNAPILIDPDSFEKYEVNAVPAIVLTQEETYDKIVGNVPISYALEAFGDKGDSASLAKEILLGFRHTSSRDSIERGSL